MTDAETLPRRLDAGDMVVYVGFDPTADSLHVGNLQQIVLLQRFQLAGHRPIALLGGGTGMIGDPSGKSEERVLLDLEQVAANTEAIGKQLSRFLDFSPAPCTLHGHRRPAIRQGSASSAILADNSEWLTTAKLLDFLRDVGKLFSVNEMIRKDSVRSRLEGRDQGLSFTEFSYMLLQAWDFLQLYERYHCELQIGGSDQWGNITEGVDLVRRRKGATVYGLTSPLVTRSDGTKFGKTESGNVWLDAKRTSPYEFYQFWVRTPDADAGSYLRRFTHLEKERIEELETALLERPERREAQKALAFELTAMVHGDEEAFRAREAAEVLFTEGITRLDPATLEAALADAPSTPVGAAELELGISLVEALLRTGLATSKRDARQLLAQGSVYVNGTRATQDRVLGFQDALHARWVVLRRGKAHQHVLVLQR